MAAEKIATDTLIEIVTKHISDRKAGGMPRVKITFEGDMKDPKGMNEISFGMGFYKIEKADVPKFHAAVKSAGGTPWDYYDDVEFSL